MKNHNDSAEWIADFEKNENGNVTKVYTHGQLKIPCAIGGKCLSCGAPLDTGFKCTKCGEQHTLQVSGGGSGRNEVLKHDL